jgi:RNA recognition motif-containing protein
MWSNKSVATQTTATSSSTSASSSPCFPKKLFLAISPSTSEAGLRYFFERRNFQVNYVRVLNNKETGQSKGMAFVAFRSHEQAAAAIQQANGAVLDRMILHPEWAQPPRKQKLHNKRNGSRKNKNTAALVA